MSLQASTSGLCCHDWQVKLSLPQREHGEFWSSHGWMWHYLDSNSLFLDNRTNSFLVHHSWDTYVCFLFHFLFFSFLFYVCAGPVFTLFLKFKLPLCFHCLVSFVPISLYILCVHILFPACSLCVNYRVHWWIKIMDWLQNIYDHWHVKWIMLIMS